jgi:hypothetical protein
LPASVTAAVHRSQNPSKQLVAGPASFGVWSFPFFCALQGDATAKPCSNNSGLQFNQCFGQWGSFHPWRLYFSWCHDTVAYLKVRKRFLAIMHLIHHSRRKEDGAEHKSIEIAANLGFFLLPYYKAFS